MKREITTEAKDLFNSYPEAIKNQLYELFYTTLKNIDLSNLVSIIFIGSGARNELSFKLHEDNLDIFSDYEFVIIVKNMLSKNEKILLDVGFKKLEDKWNIRAPLFYIDYGVSTLLKFKNTPPTLWLYEAKNLGVIVYGSDVRKELQDVTLSNLDYGNLNELVIVRLWNTLIHMNNGFIKNNNNYYENFIIKFYYSRNILDILTILLPNCNILKGGYKNRTKYFLEDLNDNRWDKYKDGFRKATDFKIDLIDDLTLKESQDIFFNGYTDLIAHLSQIKGIKGIEELETYMPVIIKSKIFKEKMVRTLRRRLMEFYLFKSYYRFDLRAIKLFTHDNLRVYLLFLLLYMHKSVSLNLSEGDKQKYFKKAIYYFNKISFQAVFYYNNNHSFGVNFINLRRRILDFMMIWFYARSNIKVDKIEGYMNWRDNK